MKFSGMTRKNLLKVSISGFFFCLAIFIFRRSLANERQVPYYVRQCCDALLRVACCVYRFVVHCCVVLLLLLMPLYGVVLIHSNRVLTCCSVSLPVDCCGVMLLTHVLFVDCYVVLY